MELRAGISGARTRWAVGLFTVAVLLLSAATVVRYTVDYLQADGVQQSVMSVQDVDLFFWGQNRFAALVSALASPVANPVANLVLSLMINAVAFHVVLLLLASMGSRVVTGARGIWPTALLFLLMTASVHAVMAPAKLHIFALESQPYSISWGAALGAFLLWKRRSWWTMLLAVALVGVAVGVNQSTILGAAFLAVIEAVRRRQWVRWPVFGVVWGVWFGVWAVLSAKFGGNAGPIPDANQEYFRFDLPALVSGASHSVTSIFEAFRPVRFVTVLVIAALCLVLVPSDRRSAMLPSLGLATAFGGLYWAVFTGNPWVAANGFVVRYFFPVVVLLLVALAASIAAALVALTQLAVTYAPRVRAGGVRASVVRGVAVGATAFAAGLALVGPVSAPANATVLVQTRATADFARANGITFISGYYWDMWPVLHRALTDGRHAAFVVAFKSGGDPAAYHRAFDAEVARPGQPPRAICVNDTLDVCRTYLDYWTRPGWVDTGATCPVPGTSPLLGSPPERSCRVLEYSGAAA